MSDFVNYDSILSEFKSKYNNISDLGSDLSGKSFSLRVDMNVPLSSDGKIEDNERIVQSLNTAKYLLSCGCRKIVFITHIGRPKGVFSEELSVVNIVVEIEECLGESVLFCKTIKEAKSSDAKVVLLENVRFDSVFFDGGNADSNIGSKNEESGDEGLAKELSELSDYYVNDAFSCSHRAHASMSVVGKFCKVYAGISILNEIQNAEPFLENKAGTMVVVGGAKISTKIALLFNISTFASKIAIVGAMANTFLKVMGHQVGRSLCEDGFDDMVKSIFDNAKKYDCQIILPKDVVVLDSITDDVCVKLVSQVQENDVIYDLGSESVREIENEITGEIKTVVWNGPVGMFEKEPFDAGTEQLAKCLADKTSAGEIKSIISGGDTSCAVKKCKLSARMSHVSMGGGAFLELMEGKELPGIVAIKKDA